MAVPRMLPAWVQRFLASALIATCLTAARAGAQEPPAPGPAEAEPEPAAVESESKSDSESESEPAYPVYDVEARFIGGLERRLEHPRATQVGEHSRQPFFLDRARVELDIELNKWLSSSLSAEFTDDVSVRDAYVNTRIKRWFQIQVGRFKRPISRIELIGRNKLPFRERGIFNDELIRGAEWGNRSVGAMLWGKVRSANLEWNLAVMNAAESMDRRRPELIRGADVLGRVEYEPTEWLAVAVNGGYKNTEPYLNGPNIDLLAVGGDVRIRAAGLRVVLDSMYAQNPRPPAPPSSRGRTPFALGVNGYATYDFSLGMRAVLQPMVGGEWVDTDLDLSEDETARGVAGINLLLFDGAYRVLPQVEIVRPLGDVGARSRVKTETYYLMFMAEL